MVTRVGVEGDHDRETDSDDIDQGHLTRAGEDQETGTAIGTEREIDIGESGPRQQKIGLRVDVNTEKMTEMEADMIGGEQKPTEDMEKKASHQQREDKIGIATREVTGRILP